MKKICCAEISGGGAFLSFFQWFYTCKKINKIYNSDMKHHYRKFGFTLSEVLITLGIIGVVAALTLPVMVNNYKQKVLIVAWKKEFSTMAQVFQAVQDGNNGSIKSVFNNRYELSKSVCEELKCTKIVNIQNKKVVGTNQGIGLLQMALILIQGIMLDLFL